MSDWPLVLVEWIDPSSDGGWLELDAILADVASRDDHCRTVGWIIHDEADYVVVAGSVGLVMDGKRQVGDVSKFPRGCLVSVTPLKPRSAK